MCSSCFVSNNLNVIYYCYILSLHALAFVFCIKSFSQSVSQVPPPPTASQNYNLRHRTHSQSLQLPARATATHLADYVGLHSLHACCIYKDTYWLHWYLTHLLITYYFSLSLYAVYNHCIACLLSSLIKPILCCIVVPTTGTRLYAHKYYWRLTLLLSAVTYHCNS